MAIQVLTRDALSYTNYESGKVWVTDGDWLHVYGEENKRLASFRAYEVIVVQEKQG